MSTKKSKQKCGKGIAPKEDKAGRKSDVLVLPPDLLEKLGINLENIKTPQQFLEKNAGVCSNLDQCLITPETPEFYPENTYTPNEENNSSILETANLMKASVFLSPTFSLLKPNNFLDTDEKCIEELIAKSADDVDIESQNEIFDYKDEIKADIMKISNIHIKKESDCNHEMKTNMVKTMDSVEPTRNVLENKLMVSTQSCMELNIKPYTLSPEKVVLERKLEINSNLDFRSEENGEKLDTTQTCNKINSVDFEMINIGEILDNNLPKKNVSRDKKAKIESLIINANPNEISKLQEDQTFSTLTNGNVFSSPGASEYQITATSEKQNSKILNDIGSLHNLEDIASNLNKECYVDQDKSMINNINTTGDSKLCIQGVEKPGGESHQNVNLNRNIKTYSKQKYPKLSNTVSDLLPLLEYNINNDIDYKINDKDIHGGTLNIFCLCEDFGTLNNYDDDVNHEHIHFWERKGDNCTIDTLLSIYNDNFEDTYRKDTNSNTEVGEINVESQLDIPYDSVMGICWNYTGNGYEERNLEYIQQESRINNNIDNMKQRNSVDKILKNSKRKRSDKTSGTESDGEKPSPKKVNIAVKCGVCNCKVSKNDWDNHVSEEHCFIAWAAGQKIVWEEKDLLMKLNERLKITNKLTCTFCKLNLHDVQTFMDHVWKCKERKYLEKATTEHPDFNVKVKMLQVELKNNQCIEVPEIHFDKNLQHSQKIQKNDEEQEETSFAAEIVLQPNINENQIFNESDSETQKHSPKTVKLDKEIRQTNTRQEPVISTETKLKRFNEVSTSASVLQLKNENTQKQEQPLVQTYKRPRNQSPTLISQIKIEEKSIPDEPGLNLENNEKQTLEITVPQMSAEKQQSKLSKAKVEKGVPKFTCGVCNEVVCESSWINHITEKHNYLAWRDDQSPLDFEDENEIRNYLNVIIKEVGELVCKGCGLKRKFAKSYLKHIKNCESMINVAGDQVLVIKTEKVEKEKKIAKLEKMMAKCAVCKAEVEDNNWIDHIFKEHDYIAWKEGEPEIDVNNSQQVYEHLFNIKPSTGLICKKCGSNRRYVKSYLKHIETCGNSSEKVLDISYDPDGIDSIILNLSNGEDAICGVCKMDVEGKHWFNHVHLNHAYLAWKEGKRPLDLKDEEEVYNYLYILSKKYNGLTCNKCGLNRKYVKAFLTHLEECNSELFESSKIVGGVSDKDLYECAVCSKAVSSKDWNMHAMKVHYNLTWFVGDYPIDIKKTSVIEKQLKALKKELGKLKCNNCGETRISPMGFYAHIIQCGKTEEEIDEYKTYCELCNNKYLAIYKSQHLIMHRELEFKERRLLEAKQETEIVESPKIEQLSERRRAAEKAREFIEKSEKFEFNCPKCGYGADDQAELDEHTCSKTKFKEYVESEESADMSSSDNESVDSLVDSNLSDEEVCLERARKRHDVSSAAATKVTRIPFTIKCAKSFVKQSADDYHKTFLTSETLYPQWRSCNVELIATKEIDTYMPPLKESCKVILHRADPVIYKQFEAKKHKGCSVFVGGCIQCISWAPPHLDDSNDDFGHFMAVAVHNDVDTPRLNFANLYESSGLLQIWDFGNLSNMSPEFALGIAHDYGTVWAIDWCPSGARDEPIFPDQGVKLESFSDSFVRLGLLAIACSNGSAYIFSVPYPSCLKTSNKKIYRLSPVAELRLFRGKRDGYQATSISWSVQSGHDTVVVGYSDGSVASYNLACESPLLSENEDGVNIFYPFQDVRPHSSTITDVKTFPSITGDGLLSSVSPTGSESAQQRGSSRVYRLISSASGTFAPHWPSVMLSGNEIIVNQTVNELDLWGVGRRTGAVHKSCGCLHCGHMATFAPPVMKILTTHPAYIDFQKEPIALIEMTPLGQKRSKEKIDKHQLKLEPFTYKDVVASYALNFKLLRDLDKEAIRYINRPRNQYPERFPLSDVPSMAFYPSVNHHRKLAVATHAGIIFILTDDVAL